MARSRTFMVPRSHSNQNPMLLRPHAIFRQRIGPQIVPLFTHPIPPLAHCPSLPPAEFMSCLLSCNLCYTGKEAVNSRGVLDTL